MKLFLNLKTILLLCLIGFYLVVMFSNFTTYEGARNMEEEEKEEEDIFEEEEEEEEEDILEEEEE